MDDQGQVRILRQRSSVDVEDLRAFLAESDADVSVEDIQAGPQANVDWFLPPTLSVIFNTVAAHPYLACFVAWAATKSADKLSDAAAEKLVSKLFTYVSKVYPRAKAAALTFVRGEKVIPVPPLRLTFDLFNSDITTKQTTVTLVFPDDLTDAQIHQALNLVPYVITASKKRDEERGEYEKRVRQLIESGQQEESMALMLDEAFVELRRPALTYVYRPKESAWVDAWVLAEEPLLLQRVNRLKEMLKGPSPEVKQYQKDFEQMLQDAERKIDEARIKDSR
jgi:hypothetical protein